ncbi:MAG: hypothetical protein HOH65_09395 [Rhodospirillaceae bacterium]|nr:hypothetical protein [Rhodospirillaceae bacterium]
MHSNPAPMAHYFGDSVPDAQQHLKTLEEGLGGRGNLMPAARAIISFYLARKLPGPCLAFFKRIQPDRADHRVVYETLLAETLLEFSMPRAAHIVALGFAAMEHRSQRTDLIGAIAMALASSSWSRFRIAVQAVEAIDPDAMTDGHVAFLKIAKECQYYFEIARRDGWNTNTLAAASRQLSRLGAFGLDITILAAAREANLDSHFVIRCTDHAMLYDTDRAQVLKNRQRSHMDGPDDEQASTGRELITPDQRETSHTLPEDRFTMSGHGKWSRYVPGGDDSRTSMEIGGPFTIDHNHVQGVGVFHLVFSLTGGWRKLPAPDPKPMSPIGLRAHFDDLRGGVLELSLGVSGQGKENFALALNVQAANRGSSHAPSTVNSTGWRHDGVILLSDFPEHSPQTVRFDLAVDEGRWSYLAGNHNLLWGLKRKKYLFGSLIDALAMFDSNFVFTLIPLRPGLKTDTLRLNFGSIRLRRPDHSLLRAGRTRLVRHPGDDPAQARRIHDGRTGTAHASWFGSGTPNEDQVFEFELPSLTRFSNFRLHQNSDQPTREARIEVAIDGEFLELWRGILAMGRPEWGEGRVTDIELDRPIASERVRLTLASGWHGNIAGLALFEGFGVSDNEEFDHFADTGSPDLPVPVGDTAEISDAKIVAKDAAGWVIAVRINRMGRSCRLRYEIAGNFSETVETASGQSPTPATFFYRIPSLDPSPSAATSYCLVVSLTEDDMLVDTKRLLLGHEP